MTVTISVKDDVERIVNVTSVKRSSRKGCDYCAIDTFKNEYHFSHLQLQSIT